MMVSKQEQELYGTTVRATLRDDNCIIYRLEDATGEAVLTRYEVYPGIALVYNDVHKYEISVEDTKKFRNILEINHCREGRIEFETVRGEYVYIKKGDMAVNTKAGVKNYSYFPQNHYHGVTIELNLDQLKEHLPDELRDFQVDPAQIEANFCADDCCSFFHEIKEFEHLFEELYCVPEKIRNRYYKLKIVEILLFLSVLDVKIQKVQSRYFNKELVAAVKEVHSYLTSHFEEKITIDQLCAKFNVSSTNLKSCFKEVYGNSIYAYLKEYRICKAAELLRETDYDIGRIAGMVGYDNASKFAKSFHSIMGINPREYKRSV